MEWSLKQDARRAKDLEVLRKSLAKQTLCEAEDLNQQFQDKHTPDAAGGSSCEPRQTVPTPLQSEPRDGDMKNSHVANSSTIQGVSAVKARRRRSTVLHKGLTTRDATPTIRSGPAHLPRLEGLLRLLSLLPVLVLLRRQRLREEEGEGCSVHGLACRTSQRRTGEMRQAVP